MKIFYSLRLLLLQVLFLFILPPSFSQSIIIIGNGTNSNTNTTYPAPYGAYYFGAKHQILYKASELISAGMMEGEITSLSFNVKEMQGDPLAGFTIRLKLVSKSNLNNTFENTGMTTVYTTSSYTDAAGWNEHQFSSPFYWNGTSDLLVETCFNNTSYTFNAVTYYTATAFNSVVMYRQDESTVCNVQNGNTSSLRPNIKIKYNPVSQIPIAEFSTSAPFSCDGQIAFTDGSCCMINAWLWDFGDGSGSTLQNPTHNYSSSGVYDVKLIVTNSNGMDTMFKPNYITISIGQITPAVCVPPTLSYCCGFGITKVKFGSINNISGNGSEGYSNYSCDQNSTNTEGTYVNYEIETKVPDVHNIRGWLDLNNDGDFSSQEMIISADNVLSVSDSILVPKPSVYNTILRLRISADYAGNPAPGPCDSPVLGQVEDYSVTILSNNSPPVGDFYSGDTINCTGVTQFISTSFNSPQFWQWDFGDGTGDTVENPIHVYAVDGNYSVRLIVSNSYGLDTLIRNQYIKVKIDNFPKAASCIPQTISYCCNYGVTSFTIDGIGFSSANASEGYMDFSCGKGFELTEGKSYPYSIGTNPLEAQDSRVYIDLNNNGVFDPANELVIKADNLINPSGTFTMPTGVKDSLLRLRIISDYAGGLPGPCTNLIYGQAEDYYIKILENTDPPVSNFSSDKIATCDGQINFINNSLNSVGWLWDFGDGNFSSEKDPVHDYIITGVFDVTLISYNSFGADTLEKPMYITIASTTGNLSPPSCYPLTLSNCCGIGISNVNLKNINFSSVDGQEGYMDRTCEANAILFQGENHTIQIKTGATYNEYAKAYIDFNNNGSFNESNELIYSGYGLMNHSGVFNIPSTAVTGISIRLRVISDYNVIMDACDDPTYGQAEDYSITITENNLPPVAGFSSDKTITCNGMVAFSDTSNFVPTTWLWDFGDGSFSGIQNPVHNYLDSGIFTVKLMVCNAFGCDSITKANFISSNKIAPLEACTCSTATTWGNYGIYEVQFGTINKSSGNALEGYMDFTCEQSTEVTAGNNYGIGVKTSQFDFDFVYCYIDFNNDGNFTGNEKTFASSGYYQHNGTIFIPSGGTVMDSPLRMRVVSQDSTPCGNINYGQAEDYTVIVRPSPVPPVAAFQSPSIICLKDFSLTNLSENASVSQWSFGDGFFSSEFNPTHIYASPGNYSISLKVCNDYGCDSILEDITVINGTGPVDACIPVTNGYCCNYGVYNFSLETINNNSTGGINGFEDFSCSIQTELIAGENYSVQLITDSVNTETVGIWIDYNNDANLDWSELVFYSNALKEHAGNFIVPSNSIKDLPLRLRISSGTWLGTSCMGNNGQFEDYAVVIRENTSKPISFIASLKVGCDGNANFIDSSRFIPTSWNWDFGDGQNSNEQNPEHIYSSSGNYNVKLIACNGFGCDTSGITLVVNSGSILQPASCLPATQTNCCGIGIMNVSFNDINYSSENADEGFSDFSCMDSTSIIIGKKYNISVTTGTTYEEYVKVYIDYDNDGIFNETSELEFEGYGLGEKNGFITINNGVTGEYIRMRVGSCYSPIVDACSPLAYGQFEDYQVKLLTNTDPPVAGFSENVWSTCSGLIKFSDTSLNEVTTWLWQFGDGSSSILQNPEHQYAAPGIYTVSVKVCNSFGCDSIVKQDLINFTNMGPVNSGCQPVSVYCCGLGIINVNLGTINNSSQDGIDGYMDYSCDFATDLTNGNTYSVSVTTSSNYMQYLHIYIDFNNDGNYPISELVFSDYATGVHSGNILIDPGTAEYNTLLRMRIIADYYQPMDACSCQYGQIEDYAVRIIPLAPVVDFSANQIIGIPGSSISFTDLTSNAPNSWNWEFQGGDPANSQLKNPVIIYNAPGVYAVKLKAGNSFATDSLTKSAYISIQDQAILSSKNYFEIKTSSCDNPGSFNLPVKNDGSMNLQYYFSTPQPWIILPDSGILLPSDSINELVKIDFTGMAPGIYNGILNIHSNDPSNPVFIINIKLQIYNYPCADFSYSYTCGGPVYFIDQSVNNPSSWYWEFGDGGTSTIKNPSHVYSANGIYSVKLVVCKSGLCDTIYKENFIVTSDLGPIIPSCTPATINYCCGVGILEFNLETINNLTFDGIEGYQDFSCSKLAALKASNSYPLKIKTGPGFNENVKVWIDYNNNGSFEDTELIADHSGTGLHEIIFTVGAATQLDVPLRLRVISDFSQAPISDGCYQPLYGQVEDYGVVITRDNTIPVADFDYVIDTCKATVNFINKSFGSSTSYFWDFDNGITSNEFAPSVKFDSSGIYNIILKTFNTIGIDSMKRAIEIDVLKTSFTVVDSSSVGVDVLLKNTSSGAITNSWDFGDGSSSADFSPAHTYLKAGTFNISLTGISKWGCMDTATGVVVVRTIDPNIKISPNPFIDFLNIYLPVDGEKAVSIRITDLMGRTIYSHKLLVENFLNATIDLSEIAKSSYLVFLSGADKPITVLIIKQ